MSSKILTKIINPVWFGGGLLLGVLFISIANAGFTGTIPSYDEDPSVSPPSALRVDFAGCGRVVPAAPATPYYVPQMKISWEPSTEADGYVYYLKFPDGGLANSAYLNKGGYSTWITGSTTHIETNLLNNSTYSVNLATFRNLHTIINPTKASKPNIVTFTTPNCDASGVATGGLVANPDPANPTTNILTKSADAAAVSNTVAPGQLFTATDGRASTRAYGNFSTWYTSFATEPQRESDIKRDKDYCIFGDNLKFTADGTLANGSGSACMMTDTYLENESFDNRVTAGYPVKISMWNVRDAYGNFLNGAMDVAGDVSGTTPGTTAVSGQVPTLASLVYPVGPELLSTHPGATRVEVKKQLISINPKGDGGDVDADTTVAKYQPTHIYINGYNPAYSSGLVTTGLYQLGNIFFSTTAGTQWAEISGAQSLLVKSAEPNFNPSYQAANLGSSNDYSRLSLLPLFGEYNAGTVTPYLYGTDTTAPFAEGGKYPRTTPSIIAKPLASTNITSPDGLSANTEAPYGDLDASVDQRYLSKSEQDDTVIGTRYTPIADGEDGYVLQIDLRDRFGNVVNNAYNPADGVVLKNLKFAQDIARDQIAIKTTDSSLLCYGASGHYPNQTMLDYNNADIPPYVRDTAIIAADNTNECPALDVQSRATEYGRGSSEGNTLLSYYWGDASGSHVEDRYFPYTFPILFPEADYDLAKIQSKSGTVVHTAGYTGTDSTAGYADGTADTAQVNLGTGDTTRRLPFSSSIYQAALTSIAPTTDFKHPNYTKDEEISLKSLEYIISDADNLTTRDFGLDVGGTLDDNDSITQRIHFRPALDLGCPLNTSTNTPSSPENPGCGILKVAKGVDAMGQNVVQHQGNTTLSPETDEYFLFHLKNMSPTETITLPSLLSVFESFTGTDAARAIDPSIKFSLLPEQWKIGELSSTLLGATGASGDYMTGDVHIMQGVDFAEGASQDWISVYSQDSAVTMIGEKFPYEWQREGCAYGIGTGSTMISTAMSAIPVKERHTCIPDDIQLTNGQGLRLLVHSNVDTTGQQFSNFDVRGWISYQILGKSINYIRHISGFLDSQSGINFNIESGSGAGVIVCEDDGAAPAVVKPIEEITFEVKSTCAAGECYRLDLQVYDQEGGAGEENLAELAPKVYPPQPGPMVGGVATVTGGMLKDDSRAVISGTEYVESGGTWTAESTASTGNGSSKIKASYTPTSHEYVVTWTWQPSDTYVAPDKVYRDAYADFVVYQDTDANGMQAPIQEQYKPFQVYSKASAICNETDWQWGCGSLNGLYNETAVDPVSGMYLNSDVWNGGTGAKSTAADFPFRYLAPLAAKVAPSSDYVCYDPDTQDITDYIIGGDGRTYMQAPDSREVIFCATGEEDILSNLCINSAHTAAGGETIFPAAGAIQPLSWNCTKGEYTATCKSDVAQIVDTLTIEPEGDNAGYCVYQEDSTDYSINLTASLNLCDDTTSGYSCSYAWDLMKAGSSVMTGNSKDFSYTATMHGDYLANLKVTATNSSTGDVQKYEAEQNFPCTPPTTPPASFETDLKQSSCYIPENKTYSNPNNYTITQANATIPLKYFWTFQAVGYGTETTAQVDYECAQYGDVTGYLDEECLFDATTTPPLVVDPSTCLMTCPSTNPDCYVGKECVDTSVSGTSERRYRPVYTNPIALNLKDSAPTPLDVSDADSIYAIDTTTLELSGITIDIPGGDPDELTTGQFACEAGESYTLRPDVHGGWPPYTYAWHLDAGTTGTMLAGSLSGEEVTVTCGQYEGTATVTLTVTAGPAACLQTATASLTLTVDGDDPIPWFDIQANGAICVKGNNLKYFDQDGTGSIFHTAVGTSEQYAYVLSRQMGGEIKSIGFTDAGFYNPEDPALSANIAALRTSLAGITPNYACTTVGTEQITLKVMDNIIGHEVLRTANVTTIEDANALAVSVGTYSCQQDEEITLSNATSNNCTAANGCSYTWSYNPDKVTIIPDGNLAQTKLICGKKLGSVAVTLNATRTSDGKSAQDIGIVNIQHSASAPSVSPGRYSCDPGEKIFMGVNGDGIEHSPFYKGIVMGGKSPYKNYSWQLGTGDDTPLGTMNGNPISPRCPGLIDAASSYYIVDADGKITGTSGTGTPVGYRMKNGNRIFGTSLRLEDSVGYDGLGTDIVTVRSSSGLSVDLKSFACKDGDTIKLQATEVNGGTPSMYIWTIDEVTQVGDTNNLGAQNYKCVYDSSDPSKNIKEVHLTVRTDDTPVKVGVALSTLTILPNTDDGGDDDDDDDDDLNPNPLKVTLSGVDTAYIVDDASSTASFTARASVSGGTSPYTYAWYLDGTQNTSCDTLECSFASVPVGQHSVIVLAADKAQYTANAYANTSVQVEIVDPENPPSGCVSSFESVLFTTVADIMKIFTEDASICPGGATPHLLVDLQKAPTALVWSCEGSSSICSAVINYPEMKGHCSEDGACESGDIIDNQTACPYLARQISEAVSSSGITDAVGIAKAYLGKSKSTCAVVYSNKADSVAIIGPKSLSTTAQINSYSHNFNSKVTQALSAVTARGTSIKADAVEMKNDASNVLQIDGTALSSLSACTATTTAGTPCSLGNNTYYLKDANLVVGNDTTGKYKLGTAKDLTGDSDPTSIFNEIDLNADGIKDPYLTNSDTPYATFVSYGETTPITIIIEGGDLIFRNNFQTKAPVGFIVLRSYDNNYVSGKCDKDCAEDGGNIYVEHRVTDIEGYFYAEGSLMSAGRTNGAGISNADNVIEDNIFYGEDSAKTGTEYLSRQLFISGLLISRNTVGYDDTELPYVDFASNKKLLNWPNGQLTTTATSAAIAQRYALGYVRPSYTFTNYASFKVSSQPYEISSMGWWRLGNTQATLANTLVKKSLILYYDPTIQQTPPPLFDFAN